jgi:hypothetical protein
MIFKVSIHIFRQSIGSPKVCVWEFIPLNLASEESEPLCIWNLVRNNMGDHFDALEFKDGLRMVRTVNIIYDIGFR